MIEGILESIYSGVKIVLGIWGEVFDGGLLMDMDMDDIKCVWMFFFFIKYYFCWKIKKVIEDILNFKLFLLFLYEYFNYIVCLSF